jgi:hypothetical protein
MNYGQTDLVAGTGTHRGIFNGFSKWRYILRVIRRNDKTSVKEDGSLETTWEGPGRRLEEPASLRMSKALAYREGHGEAAFTEWEGEVEY